MKKIAIIGSGPTGIYTFYSLLNNAAPLSITVFEKADQPGVGMPYSDEDNSRLMLANIASIEIPPIFITYLDWLKQQSAAHLTRYHVDSEKLHDRQFLPRILLGEYFHDRFLAVVAEAKKSGFHVEVHPNAEVTDIKADADGVALSVNDAPFSRRFDLAVVATGHVWPDENETTRAYFPSPWSGLMDAEVRACEVGIMGTSLSGLDAAMAVVMQHGRFSGEQFVVNKGSEGLKITLMSRTGVLPEADFYCPIPYEPLSVLTESVAESEIAKGPDGLLDRIFALMVKELELADPRWCQAISLVTLNADTLRDVWFEDRKKHGPFTWAEANLKEVERNKREKRTVAWRYTVLRLHEVVQAIVPSLSMTESGLNPGWNVCLSIIMPPFHRSLSAGYWRCARQGSLAWSHSVIITTWISAAIRPSSPRQKSVTASTCLLMRAGKSHSETRTFPSPPCVNSLRKPAMTSRTWGKTIRCWRLHH